MTRWFALGCVFGVLLFAPSAWASGCDDGIDNDGDGLIDFPDDPGCADAASVVENPPCEPWIPSVRASLLARASWLRAVPDVRPVTPMGTGSRIARTTAASAPIRPSSMSMATSAGISAMRTMSRVALWASRTSASLRPSSAAMKRSTSTLIRLTEPSVLTIGASFHQSPINILPDPRGRRRGRSPARNPRIPSCADR